MEPMMRVVAVVTLMVASLTGVAACGNAEERPATPSEQAPAAPTDPLAGRIEGVGIETLLTSALEMAPGIELIVSRVRIPPHTTLPKHYHPGEEFIYVLEGDGVLWLEGQGDHPVKAGEVVKVPKEAVHTFITGERSAYALVCRVHESGKPMRYEVDVEDR
jgi:quercetin dioxygenase-like cupin family protein